MQQVFLKYALVVLQSIQNFQEMPAEKSTISACFESITIKYINAAMHDKENFVRN